MADDWNPDTMPDAVTDPDVREASEEQQAYTRRQRLDHTATVEANRGTPELDPARQGAFEQKPDVQQQQIELWAYKALAYFDENPAADWPQFIRIYELPEVWVDSLVRPRTVELQSRRQKPGAVPADFSDLPGHKPVAGLFEPTEVQLEGGPGPKPPVPESGDTGRVYVPNANEPPPQVIPSSALREAGEAALLTALKQIEDGMHVEAALIERLERLAGL